MMIKPQFIFTALTMAMTAITAASTSTIKTELAQGWQAVTTRPAAEVPPAEGWAEIKVPDFSPIEASQGGGSRWYRHTLPPVMPSSGQRMFVDLRCAPYSPLVAIDGKRVAERFDGWAPFRVEITKELSDGKQHELEVRVRDKSATFADGFILPPGAGEDALRGKVLGPVGGYKDPVGLRYPVYLETTPAAFIDETELVITPSVRTSSLGLSGKADGASPANKVLIQISEQKAAEVTVDAEGNWKTLIPFPHAHCWSPEDPYLYSLKVDLVNSDGSLVHSIQKSFGFKEFWTSGPDFYLNGIKRHILASATWPSYDFVDPKQISGRILAAKKTGIIALRLHIGPWQEDFLDAADKLGLMLIPEMGVYTDGSGFYVYKDPRFWKNYQDMTEGLIKRDRNHASVIMWSLGNEIRFMGNEKYDADLPKKQGRLADFARALDPIHPLTFEADLDPDGKYDVIGLHYPHEMPWEYAYPPAADWLGTRTLTQAGGGMLGAKSSDFKWDRKKPLYIGEYLWCPQADFSLGSIYFGDEVYQNRAQYNERAVAKAWIDQTISYRRSGVSGLSPWSALGFGIATVNPVLGAAQAFAYKPVAAYLRNRNFRVYRDGIFKAEIDVFNDSTEPKIITLKIINSSGRLVKSSPELRMGPAEYQKVDLNLGAPSTGSVSKLKFVLIADHQSLDEGTFEIEISDRRPVTHRIVLHGTSADAEVLAGAMPTSDVVEVATGAIDQAATRVPSFITALKSFAFRGGRILVQEQSSLSSLGLPIELVAHHGTMSFSSAQLPETKSDDFKFWGDALYVAKNEVARSGRNGSVSLAVSGGPDALASSPLTIVRYGKGAFLLCQLLTESARKTDPAIQRVEQAAVNYLKNLAPARSGKVFVLDPTPGVKAIFQAVNLDAEFISKPLQRSATPVAGYVVCGGGLNVKQSLQFLRHKRNLGVPLVLVQPTNEVLASFGIRDCELSAANAVPVKAVDDCSLLDGITREEFSTTSFPVGWDRQMHFKSNRVPRALVPVGALSKVASIGASQFLVNGEKNSQNEIMFDRPGSVEADLSVRSSGLYRISFQVQGVQENRELPIAAILLDNRLANVVSVNESKGEIDAMVKITAGNHKIGATFLNGNTWGGVRTMKIFGAALMGPINYPRSIKVLAYPGALTQFDDVKAPVIIDTIDWWQDPEMKTKAQRYWGALLFNLGMPFTVAGSPKS